MKKKTFGRFQPESLDKTVLGNFALEISARVTFIFLKTLIFNSPQPFEKLIYETGCIIKDIFVKPLLREKLGLKVIKLFIVGRLMRFTSRNTRSLYP